MAWQPMKGVKVVEVAQFTFVPAAGAILADWGADVIKIEHPVRGDTQRGFVNIGGIVVNPQRSPFVEHPNRGKRSVGIDVSTPGGQVATAVHLGALNALPQTHMAIHQWCAANGHAIGGFSWETYEWGDGPAAGSSNRISRGAPASAMPISSCRCWPWASAATGWSATPVRWTCSSNSSAAARVVLAAPGRRKLKRPRDTPRTARNRLSRADRSRNSRDD